MEDENSDTNCDWRTWKNPETVEKGKNRNNSDYSIFKIRQDTEKSPGDLRELSFTETLVKNHLLTLV